MTFSFDEVIQEIAHQKDLVRRFAKNIQRLDTQIATLGEAHAPVGLFNQRDENEGKRIEALAKIEELEARHQIPHQGAGAETGHVETGPPVQWAKETNDLVLQGWFAPESQLYDVSLVLKAANRARSVCRVEIGAIDAMGTGVLVAPKFVLTNYHVLGKDLAAPPEFLEQNASSTVLRFGAFTAKAATSMEGQEVRLAATNPIVAYSPQYDFVLLRTDDVIETVVDVEPFAEVGRTPVKRDTLYVLQHPEGGPMKVALNTNGVTWVDPGLVTLQYTTKVAGGSSGSPCFDNDWNLIALHHAGSSSREGILMSRIFGKIKDHL